MKKNIFILFILLGLTVFPLSMDAPALNDPFLANQREQEIDSSVLYEAFKSGDYERIIAFCKKDDPMQWIFPYQEALAPSVGTLQLQEIVHCLLQEFDSVSFMERENVLHVVYQDKTYNFSNILKKANFQHIKIPEVCLSRYHELLQTSQLIQKPYVDSLGRYPSEEDFVCMDPCGQCASLTLSEKEAINIYTGKLYRAMNAFLRGEVQVDLGLPDQNSNHWIKELLLHSVVAISGINKLPDYSESGSEKLYLYRVEKELPSKELNKRCWAVLCGGGITSEMGLLSTAYLRPAEDYLNENTQVCILIENLKGKDITPLSRCEKREREVVLPPTQFQWLHTAKMEDPVSKNELFLFIARPVTVDSDYTVDAEVY